MQEKEIQIQLREAQELLRGGRIADAEALCRHLEALSLSDGERVVLWDVLGACLRMNGDFAGALDVCMRTLNVLERLFGAEHQHLAGVLENLALLQAKRGLFSQAQASGQRAVKILEKNFCAQDPRIADALIALSSAYYEAKNFDQAELLLQRALKIWDEAAGRRCMGVSTCLNNLGRICENRGDSAQGAALHAEASDIRKEVLGDHPDTAFSLGNYGAALAGDGQWTRAADILKDALDMYARLGMENSADAQSYRQNLELCRSALSAGVVPKKQ